MRLLFVKARLSWPRTYGHDVHSFEMMRALGRLGHEVALATDAEPAAAALEGLHLDARWVLDNDADAPPVPMSYLQERYRSYWGIGHGRIAALRRIAAEWRADAVVVVGLEILPYLAAPEHATRIWYAADEWVLHYLTQIRSDPKGTPQHLRQAAIKGLYERAFAPLMDRVWVVSASERRAMRLFAGCRHVDVVPNGVDADTYAAASNVAAAPESVVFWGRLGFGPNLQGLRWFLTRVWPLVRRQTPGASFAILGADPPDEITGWHGRDGVSVLANLEDLRPEIAQRAVAVLPFVSGGGIKNKLLEAAAMGRPIVATPHATQGLRSRPPIAIANGPDAFATAITALWHDPARAAELGRAAHDWVVEHHTWTAAAREALAPLRSITATDQAPSDR